MSGRGFNPWYYSRDDYSRDHRRDHSHDDNYFREKKRDEKKDCVSIYSLLSLDEQKYFQEAFKRLAERKPLSPKQKLKCLQEFVAEMRKLGITNRCFLVGSLVSDTSTPLSDADLAIRIKELDVETALDLFNLQKSFLENKGVFVDILIENHHLHGDKRIIPIESGRTWRSVLKGLLVVIGLLGAITLFNIFIK